MVATIVLVIGAAQPAVAVLGPNDCVDFEDLTPATVYNVGHCNIKVIDRKRQF